MKTTTASRSLRQLRSDLSGRVTGPDDAGYDEARAVFFGGFDRLPAVVVRAADASDVARVISLARIREAYPGPTWDRPAAIKGRYDPSNLFRLNQNIPPAEGGAV